MRLFKANSIGQSTVTPTRANLLFDFCRKLSILTGLLDEKLANAVVEQ